MKLLATGILALATGCSNKPSADTSSPCVRLLTVAEITELGAPPPAMKLSVAGDICSYEPAKGMTAASYNAVFGPTLGASSRADVEPTGMWGRRSLGVTSLATECGYEAWGVELPDARLLVFAHGAAGGSLGFPKQGYEPSALVKACKLIQPRLAELAAPPNGSAR